MKFKETKFAKERDMFIHRTIGLIGLYQGLCKDAGKNYTHIFSYVHGREHTHMHTFNTALPPPPPLNISRERAHAYKCT